MVTHAVNFITSNRFGYILYFRTALQFIKAGVLVFCQKQSLYKNKTTQNQQTDKKSTSHIIAIASVSKFSFFQWFLLSYHKLESFSSVSQAILTGQFFFSTQRRIICISETSKYLPIKNVQNHSCCSEKSVNMSNL